MALELKEIDSDLIESAKQIVRSHFLTPDVRRLREALERSGIDASIKTLREEERNGTGK